MSASASHVLRAELDKDDNPRSRQEHDEVYGWEYQANEQVWVTKDGKVVPWRDLDDRHLWNIARMLTRAARHQRRRAEAYENEVAPLGLWHRRRDIFYRIWRETAATSRERLCCAINELARRGLLPTEDDLRVAWDRVCGGDGGEDLSNDPKRRPWCLIELWVGFRGEPTTSAEWLATQEVQP